MCVLIASAVGTHTPISSDALVLARRPRPRFIWSKSLLQSALRTLIVGIMMCYYDFIRMLSNLVNCFEGGEGGEGGQGGEWKNK